MSAQANRANIRNASARIMAALESGEVHLWPRYRQTSLDWINTPLVNRAGTLAQVAHSTSNLTAQASITASLARGLGRQSRCHSPSPTNTYIQLIALETSAGPGRYRHELRFTVFQSAR